MKKQISLILLLRNGSEFLPKLLKSLENQDGDWEIELVVVDSESTDGGLKLISNIKNQISNNKSRNIRAVKIIKIKASEFSHGGTRNLAVQKATGEIVIFLSQDALPADKYWLQNLVNHFINPQIAGVFGRQIPREKTNPIEKYFYSVSYPQESRVIDQNSDLNFSNKNLFFSNVNAAARKEILEKFPFRENLIMSEDQFWGREVLKRGYALVYESKAEVFHSHNYTLTQLFKRYFQSGYSQRQLNMSGNPFIKGGETSLGLLKWVSKNKPRLLPSVLIYLGVKGGGFMLGRKKILPKHLEARLITNK